MNLLKRKLYNDLLVTIIQALKKPNEINETNILFHQYHFPGSRYPILCESIEIDSIT